MEFKNELLWLVLYLVTFFTMIAGYKIMGKKFLFGWVVMAVVIANIQVVVTIQLFGMITTLGNIIYGSVFLVTDILNEKYGAKEARKAVWLGFLMSISVVAVMQIVLNFMPHESDIMMPHIVAIFEILPRIVFASLIAYLISQLFDTYAYQKIKSWLPAYKHIWIRNNGSTIISQLIDTTIFVAIAFIGVYPKEIVLSIFISTYILKVLVSFADTPFVYLATKIKPISIDKGE